MVFDVKTSLIGWFLLVVISVLLWYRNDNYDRVFCIYGVLAAVILLLYYGVHSGMSPSSAGQISYAVVWIFIILLFAMVYVVTAMPSAGILTIVSIVVASFVLFFTFSGNPRIDISGEPGAPPSWYGESWSFYLIIAALIVPLLLLLVYSKWSDPVLYIAIGFLLGSALLLINLHPEERAIGLWFYSMTILILFFWVVNMF